MKIKEFAEGVRRWMAVDAPVRVPEYKSKRGWHRAAWYVVHCMENWNRPL